MLISQRIYALLREKHLTQKDLSRYTGISPAAISSWKSKGTNPSSDKIIKICEFLEVDPYYLLTGEEPATPLMVAEEATSYEAARNPDEHTLLALFRQLEPIDQGRIIGKIEQILTKENTDK